MFLLEFIAEAVGISVAQVIFMCTQLISIPAAIYFRKQLSPTRASCTLRHAFGGTLGIVFLYCCYGCPFMFSTTKLSGMAFSIHDGVHKKKEDLSPYQQKYAIRKYPSVLEVFGYVFHFAGLMCGPSFFFTDYMDFITGENYLKNKEESVHNNNSNGKHSHETDDLEKLYNTISPTKEVIKKVLVAFMCLAIYMFIYSQFTTDLNGELSFINSHGFLYRMMYITMSMVLVRYRYYFVWVMGEAMQNAAGFGLHFVNGNPQWDMNPNVNIWQIDKATSLKVMTDHWNISGAKWLRLVSYERAGKYRVVWTYLLSSVWHGVEPGYYVTFGTLALVTLVSRKLRKHVRPYFVDTKWKLHYDILTWFSSYIAMCYSMGGFHLLHWQETYNFFTYSMYWWMHILLVLIIIVPVPSQKFSQKE